MTVTYDKPLIEQRSAWSAVFSMSLCVAVLIASEFLPVSLLSPIAADLAVTEGQTGQAIAVSGVFAVITSLTIAWLTRRLDRRTVVLGFTWLLIISGLTVAMAPDYLTFMAGRAVLGIAIGGFWSMSTAIVMRLVNRADVPKGLAVLSAGNAIAATVAAPLGSFLGAHVGWRWAFLLVVPLALAALVWQRTSLPPLQPRREEGSADVLRLLGRRQVVCGMAAIFCLFMGQFALFTYLRPFLEQVTGVSVPALSTMLLIMGAAGAAGTWCIGRLLGTRLFGILVAIPLIMAGLALALIAFGTHTAVVALLLMAWGFFGTAAPVGWGTWLSRALPDDAEAGGGLQVAVIQLAITAGAATGGLLFDTMGWQSTFALGAALLAASAVLAWTTWRFTPRQAA
ncbi:MFS transporter [Mesorhizobium sp. NPDC059054]|uniref:MFS transporter n=1 Tax=Mesorhizobium sp. NPDC059054 TaxID=3346711 RepID=UPI003686A55E